MKRKTGHRDSATAPRVAQSLKRLYADARILRDTVLRRIVAAGYKIDEKSLPEAQAIVSSSIGALVDAPEFEILLGYSPGEARILTFLVQSCAAEIAAKIGPPAEDRARVRRRMLLRLVADNKQ